jgi:DNA polymerase-3 subunit delta
MEFEQIISDLKNKIHYPVYFLAGEEPYYIDEISDYIEEHVLTDVEKEFNQTVIYGRETDVQQIISYAKRYPMMANYQVVIVKEVYIACNKL